MSLLTNGVMTEDEGFMLEAADQCGMVNTDDDCEHMRGSIKAVVLFGRIMQRSGMFQALNANERADAFNAMEEIDTITGPLIEQERIESLAWYAGLAPHPTQPGQKFIGTSSDNIIDDVLTLGSGDPEAALELLIEWRAGLA